MNGEKNTELLNVLEDSLFTAVVGDVLDEMGFVRQFLPPKIRPLHDGFRVAGFAMPVLEANCFSTQIAHSKTSEPFGKMFLALDALEANDVYIATGASGAFAQWGELMSTRARFVHARGAVVDGYSRDTEGILEMDFPTFSWGTYAQDQRLRGRVIDYGCSIEFDNGVKVEPGDIVFGDTGGVVIIPLDISEEVVAASIQKNNTENLVRKSIEEGMPSAEAFARFGVM